VRTRILVVALPLVLALLSPLLTACAGGTAAAPPDPDAVVIAAFDFPESQVLAELYAQALEAADVPVRRELGLGTREFVEPALQQGLVDLVPEYGGSALAFVTLGAVEPTADGERTHDALTDALAHHGVTVLAASPAQDRNGVAVTGATADRLGLRTISDLVPHASSMVFGGPPECEDRPLCLPGLERLYRLHFEEFLPLDAGGPLTLQALRSDAVDAAIVFTSDGVAERDGLVILEDDRSLQPAENITPVARSETLERIGPTMVDTVNAVSAALTTEELRALNAEVAVDGRTPAAVAADWLQREGLDG
jgi:osmoprotectant transport system substrate-binding protein